MVKPKKTADGRKGKDKSQEYKDRMAAQEQAFSQSGGCDLGRLSLLSVNIIWTSSRNGGGVLQEGNQDEPVEPRQEGKA